MKCIEMKAYAKINLTLDVLGKREDGYHELSSVMQAVCLCDKMSIKISEQPGLQLVCDSSRLPLDEGNLAFRAAKMLLAECAVQQGVLIELEKKIPIAAGLAGGSSDAAAVLQGLNMLLGLGISQERLCKIGRRLGADVPFCIRGGTALAEGVGEKLQPLKPHPDVEIVLARLPVHVSTAEVFGRCVPGRSARSSLDMVAALEDGDINGIAKNLSNNLTPVATAMHVEIASLVSAFREQEALGVNMTGSGPTVFAYFLDKGRALAAMDHIRQKFNNCDIFLTKPNNI